MRFTKVLISFYAIFITPLFAIANVGPCAIATRGGASSMQIFATSFATLYNVFPIYIGGVPIGPVGEDQPTTSNKPLCSCEYPIPHIGISVSFWEPLAMIEPVKIPLCSPTIGQALPIPSLPGSLSFGSNETMDGGQNRTFQSHYLFHPIFKMFSLLQDFVCLTPNPSVDLAYISEVDPSWQDDILSAWLFPETGLVGNAYAEFACSADAISATTSKPIDPLFWCAGSWGGAYPISMNTKGNSSNQAQGLIVARTLLRMHRMGLLWETTGNQSMCGYMYMPFIKKSMYSIFPMYPYPFPIRFPIGRSGYLWETGHDNPSNLQVGNWMIYRKRDCCAF